MPKFMSAHSVPAGSMNRQAVDQMAQHAREAKEVRPYRSFMNVSEGKMFCVMESPDKETLAAWFKESNIPCDYITPVEFEGDAGEVKEA